MVLAEIGFRDVLLGFGIAAGIAVLLGLLVLALIARRLRQIQLPPDAGVIETLQAVPLQLVVALDLLDFGLDVFSAPVIWALLGRFGLGRLRQVATLEALVPGTQLLPTMTIAWLIARSGRALPGGSRPEGGPVIDHET